MSDARQEGGGLKCTPHSMQNRKGATRIKNSRGTGPLNKLSEIKEIKRADGWMAGGGRSKVSTYRGRGPAGVSFRDFFFRAPMFSGSAASRKNQKPLQFNGRLRPSRSREAFIFTAPGGAVKSLGPFDRGPVGPRHAFCREFPQSFFWTGSFEKSPRNSGGGGDRMQPSEQT